MSENRFSELGAKAVGLYMTTSKALEILDLTGNLVGPEGAKALGNGIRKSARIQHLTLQHMSLCGLATSDAANGSYSSIGIDSIAEGLSFVKSLTHLDVRSNGIVGDAAKQLAAAVLSSETLVVFSELPVKRLKAQQPREREDKV